jgi:hypothetical protein
MHIMQSRRDFLASLSAAGASGVLGALQSLADEGPPETTTLRLDRSANICVAPGYIPTNCCARKASAISTARQTYLTTPSHAARSTSL